MTTYTWPSMSQHDFVKTYDDKFNPRWSNSLATMDTITSEQLDLIDSLGTKNQHICPPDCICQQMKRVDEICIQDMLVTDVHTYPVPLPFTDSEIFKAIQTKNRSAVKKKLKTLFENLKGSRSKQHWLASSNQSRYLQYLEDTCTYIAELDDSAGCDEMKETACQYACFRLCCLQIKYEVAFDFWAGTLKALVLLNPKHLLMTCMDFLNTQWEAFAQSVMKQRVIKCVQLLMRHFPHEMQAHFAGVNIYVCAVSSIWHTSC